MKNRFILFVLCLLFIGSLSRAQVAKETQAVPQTARKVTARATHISMATSLSGFADPGTPLLETGGRNSDVCYPSTYRHHILREKPVNMDWNLVILENEYVRIEFAPELGGMIWRLFDKVHNIDVLHAPNKVSPTGDGFGGTYTPGGLELNFPYAHAVNNTWPRKTDFKEHADGSGSYVVSEFERNGRMQWSMEFTLRPGEARLRQEVKLYNRGKLPASFVYWGNARVPANADTRWIEPEAMASEHGGSNVFTWPIFRGVDLSLMINDPEVIGMYFLEPRYNFFGLTNLKTQSGMVHFADYRDVPGKKLWNWGRTPLDGNRKWDPANQGGSEPHWHGYEYGEVQSGRMINQDHLEWLGPEEFVSWEEAWSPIFGLTNVNEVTEDAAFQLLEKEHKLVIYPFTQAADVKLHFVVDGMQVKEIALAAKTSHLQEIDLKDFGENLADLEIKVDKGGERSGSVTIRNRCVQKKSSELREVPIFKEHSSSSLSATAEFEHKLLNRKKALSLYEQAIAVDPLNHHAHLGLGKLLFSHGDLDGAKTEFQLAIQSYKWAGEAYVLLADVELLLNDLDAAENHAYEARYYGEKARGNLKIGEVLIHRGEYRKAKEFLEEAVGYNRHSLRTYALLALCERKLGNRTAALLQLDRVPQGALQDILWYSEAFLSGNLSADQLQQELFRDEWRYLEISLDYLSLGNYSDANLIANAGIALHQQGWKLDKLYNPERTWGFGRSRETPFFHLVKGMAARRSGDTTEAARLFAAGDYFENYVNFNQPELVPVLQAAVQSGNGFASFWLGNFYYHSHRYNEAKNAWEEAAAKHPGNPQILRNLATYELHQNRDPRKSYGLLQSALAINPDNLFIRLELITNQRTLGARPDEILKSYLDAPKAQREGYLFLRGFIQAFEDAGKWKEAAEYLSTAERNWSDDAKTWYSFSIDYAEHLQRQTQPKEALQWIARSTPPPANVSNRVLPADHFYRQREYFIAALSYRALGETEKAKEYFRKVMEEPADFLFNEWSENRVTLMRFYVALAMKELGMEPAARGMLVGINEYRVRQGLVNLFLENSELERWNVLDPLSDNHPAIED